MPDAGQASTASDLKRTLLAATEDGSRLARLAVAIGMALRLTKDRLEHLYYAGLLHDVSSGSRPDDRPEGPGHPEESARIVGTLPFLRTCQQILRHHHEHFDSSGYPDGLRGEAIPLEARILQVADTFVALVSQRPHQKALTVEKALERVALERGRRFDPQIVDVLLSEGGRRIIDAYAHGTMDPSGRALEDFATQAALRLRRQVAAWTPPPAASPQKTSAPHWLARRRWQLVGGVAAGLAALVLSGAVVSASQDAVPGDTLYPVKRTMEDLQLLLTTHAGELPLHVDYAHRRLREVDALIGQERLVPDSLLADLNHETRVLLQLLEELEGDEAYRLALRLQAFGQEARSTLEALRQLGVGNSRELAPALETVTVAAYAAAMTVAHRNAPEGTGAPPPADAIDAARAPASHPAPAAGGREAPAGADRGGRGADHGDGDGGGGDGDRGKLPSTSGGPGQGPRGQGDDAPEPTETPEADGSDDGEEDDEEGEREDAREEGDRDND